MLKIGRLTTLTEKTEARATKLFIFQKQLFPVFTTEGQRADFRSRDGLVQEGLSDTMFSHVCAKEIFSFDFYDGWSPCPMLG